MASEWEELMKLPKEELVIELIHMRTLYSILRGWQDDSCTMPVFERPESGDGSHWEPGEITTDEWAERIALYAAAHPKDDVFYWCDLIDYGLTDDQAYDVCKRLRAEGRLVLPPGVEYHDPEAL